MLSVTGALRSIISTESVTVKLRNGGVLAASAAVPAFCTFLSCAHGELRYWKTNSGL